eukprot:2392317-Rhodomonas_salina.1
MYGDFAAIHGDFAGMFCALLPFFGDFAAVFGAFAAVFGDCTAMDRGHAATEGVPVLSPYAICLRYLPTPPAYESATCLRYHAIGARCYLPTLSAYAICLRERYALPGPLARYGCGGIYCIPLRFVLRPLAMPLISRRSEDRATALLQQFASDNGELDRNAFSE